MLVLGRNANRERRSEIDEVYLTDAARKQGTYIIGTTGTGKTTLLLNMIIQDLNQWEHGYHGMCVFDPHGDFTADILKRVPLDRRDSVILFDPTDTEFPFGLNLFDCNRDDPRERDRVVSTFIGTLYKLYKNMWGPRMEDLLRHSVLTLLLYPEPTTMIDLMLLMVNYDHRQRLIAPAIQKDPILRAYWKNEFPESEFRNGRLVRPKEQIELVSSSLNKIGRFITNPIIRNIVGQPTSTINFREAMDEGKIILINLSKGDLGADNASLLGSVLVDQILLAALSRRDIPEQRRRPFHLYVDEYQTFATKTFPELQSEARKYAIDTVVAHQYRDQLDEENLGSTLNVANLIVLRVSGKDAIDLAMQFDNTPSAPEVEYKPLHVDVDMEGRITTRAMLPGSQTPLYYAADGKSQLYSDVHLETANLLSQLSNYHAICRVLGMGKNPKRLDQFFIELADRPAEERQDPTLYIRQRSRKLAQFTREEIERYIAEHTQSQNDEGGSFPIEPY